MADDMRVEAVAQALLEGVGRLARRIRQLPAVGELTLPERTALSRLDRDGPATSAELARQQQVSPQSMGATLARLEQQDLIERRRDPDDGRRIVLSVTTAGRKLLRAKRSVRVQQLSDALADGFSPAERNRLMAAAPLLERLARTI
ncbi:MAG TPA: MarR family transcriptional regulator [Jatrophihabitantaceae bacterium]